MKLTNYIRDAFIKRVMTDVPYVDYSEQARILAQTTVRDAFDKQYGAGKYKSLDEAGWLGHRYVPMPRNIQNCYMAIPSGSDLGQEYPEVWAQILKLSTLAEAQSASRTALENNLRAAAYSVTTRKALADLLPEFEHYLPADDAKAIKINLPAVANLVADFTRAGWPKQKETAGA